MVAVLASWIALSSPSAMAGNTPTLVPGKSGNPRCLTSSNASPVAKSAVTKSSMKLCQAGDGLSQETAGSSAWQIKRDFPDSTDGKYWIKNSNINGGVPIQIYADMTGFGGGWTLIFANAAQGIDRAWTSTEVQSINSTSVPSNPRDLTAIQGKYSILSFANYLKKSSSGFQYRIDASDFYRWGGIWTANQDYSFNDLDNNLKTDVTENIKWDEWEYGDAGIEKRMPYASSVACGKLTTTKDVNCTEWWGTLAAFDTAWQPAPWMAFFLPNPQIIWYWVR